MRWIGFTLWCLSAVLFLGSAVFMLKARKNYTEAADIMKKQMG